MPTELMAPSDANSITTIYKTAQMIAAQRDAIVKLMRDVMKKDVDYGTIPGTPKPTLYKAGAEKLLSMFRLVGKPVVDDLSTPDMIRYQVHFVISDANGNVVGEGIGEASSAEAKYQWRRAICAEEFESFPADRKRTKWKKGQSGPYTELQVRADMEDIANTVLKMAKKRSMLDAVLTVTAASDVFSQDLEDLKDIGLDTASEQGIVDAGGNAGTPPAEIKKKEQPEPAQSGNGLFDGQQKQPATQQQRPASAPAPSRGKSVSEAQGRRFYAIARQHGWENSAINDYLQRAFGVRKSDEIPADQYEKAIAWAEGNE